MRRNPLNALFTVLAFCLSAILPDRAASREPGSTVVAHDGIVAIAAAHTTSIAPTAARKSPPRTWSIGPFAPADVTIDLPVAPARAPDSYTIGTRAAAAHAFTYDATAPPARG